MSEPTSLVEAVALAKAGQLLPPEGCTEPEVGQALWNLMGGKVAEPCLLIEAPRHARPVVCPACSTRVDRLRCSKMPRAEPEPLAPRTSNGGGPKAKTPRADADTGGGD